MLPWVHADQCHKMQNRSTRYFLNPHIFRQKYHRHPNPIFSIVYYRLNHFPTSSRIHALSLALLPPRSAVKHPSFRIRRLRNGTLPPLAIFGTSGPLKWTPSIFVGRLRPPLTSSASTFEHRHYRRHSSHFVAHLV